MQNLLMDNFENIVIRAHIRVYIRIYVFKRVIDIVD